MVNKSFGELCHLCEAHQNLSQQYGFSDWQVSQHGFGVLLTTRRYSQCETRTVC